jgi:PAS domain S-box-containing protein
MQLSITKRAFGRWRIADYAVAAACVAVALALRQALVPVLGNHFAFVFFVPAALVAAWLGGVGPGVLAMIAGFVLGELFFARPPWPGAAVSPLEIASMLAYLGICGTSIGLVEALRRARCRTERATLLAESRSEQLLNGMRELGAAEQRLREMAAIVDSAQEAIFSETLDGRIRSWNAAAETLFGYTAAEMLGQSADRLVPAGSKAELAEMRERIRRGEEVRAFETVRLTRDGRPLDVLLSLSPLRDDWGAIIGASAIVCDITHRKRSEAALRASEARFEAMANAAPVMMWICAAERRWTWCNSCWLEFTGCTRHEALGEGWADRVHADDRQRCVDAFVRAFSRRETFEAEYRVRTASGDYRWVYGRGVPHHGPDGAFLGYIGSCLDITERKEAAEGILRLNNELERRVQQRTAELENANRELEAFSYSVSHDLRAPLRSINGFSKAVYEEYADKLDERGAGYLKYAYEASLRMGRLIEDLMNLSRISGSELHRQTVDLTALASGIIEDLRQHDPQRIVKVKIAPRLTVDGDPGLLRIALENLLSNAWKFTARATHPKIELGSGRTRENRYFFVRDNGAGFDMREAARLFGVFQRLHSAREFPGTGIGLATVRRILSRHGGSIWAESRKGQGATFYFTLPEVNSAGEIQIQPMLPMASAVEKPAPAIGT